MQDIDFCEISNLSNRGFWQTESKSYLLSLDMAKELCMVERNEKGREACGALTRWKMRIFRPHPKCCACCATATWD